MTGAAVLIHGGGPTIVLNASLYGVWRACRDNGIPNLYGARNGLAGLLEEHFIDLNRHDAEVMRAVGQTPGSALGSSRRAPREEDYARILRTFESRGISYCFYNGGNGSMVTALELDRRARSAGYDLKVIGIPKTIDNDLMETDHTPGYGSTARFFACAVRDIGGDNAALPGTVTVVEVMGRNVGWLVAATTLARHNEDDPPHLVYFPERPISVDQLLSDVDAVYRRLGRCVIAVCEGQTDSTGGYFGADMHAADGFERRLAANLGHQLAQVLMTRLKVKARSEKPGVLGRSTAVIVSETDRREAQACGQAAVEAAVAGVSGKMVTLVRSSGGEYHSTTGLVDLDKVAYAERRFPEEWIAPAGNDVVPAFRDYVSPLAGEIAPRPRLV
jgi:ATP-dependent phosphofructokinase / diphosphate-dependent phosphofructokinase